MGNFDSEDLIDWQDFVGEDWDDEPMGQGDGVTSVSSGGIGMTPEQASVVPSFASRRKKRRAANIAITHSKLEDGGFQTSTEKIA